MIHNLPMIYFHVKLTNLSVKMLFLTNELAKKAEITILSARKSTRPGLQAGASWVERKPYKRKGIARDSHLGL